MAKQHDPRPGEFWSMRLINPQNVVIVEVQAILEDGARLVRVHRGTLYSPRDSIWRIEPWQLDSFIRRGVDDPSRMPPPPLPSRPMAGYLPGVVAAPPPPQAPGFTAPPYPPPPVVYPVYPAGPPIRPARASSYHAPEPPPQAVATVPGYDWRRAAQEALERALQTGHPSHWERAWALYTAEPDPKTTGDHEVPFLRWKIDRLRAVGKECSEAAETAKERLAELTKGRAAAPPPQPVRRTKTTKKRSKKRHAEKARAAQEVVVGSCQDAAQEAVDFLVKQLKWDPDDARRMVALGIRNCKDRSDLQQVMDATMAAYHQEQAAARPAPLSREPSRPSRRPAPRPAAPRPAAPRPAAPERRVMASEARPSREDFQQAVERAQAEMAPAPPVRESRPAAPPPQPEPLPMLPAAPAAPTVVTPVRSAPPPVTAAPTPAPPPSPMPSRVPQVGEQWLVDDAGRRFTVVVEDHDPSGPPGGKFEVTDTRGEELILWAWNFIKIVPPLGSNPRWWPSEGEPMTVSTYPYDDWGY